MGNNDWTPREAVEAILRDFVRRTRQHGFYTKAMAEEISYTAEVLRGATMPPVPAPPTRLREYKGVVFRDGKWWRHGEAYDSAFWVLSASQDLTDADHAALLDLRERPEEPAPDAVVEALVEWDMNSRADRKADYAGIAATVRAIVRAEVESQPLTVAEHVAALKDAGAWTCDKARRFYVCPDHGESSYQRGGDILVLPPERAP